MDTTFNFGTPDPIQLAHGMVAFSKLNWYHSRELETYVTLAKHHKGLGGEIVVEEYKVTV